MKLVRIARDSIVAGLRGERYAPPAEPELQAPAATFVTLYKSGSLCGCVGSVEALRPLGADVAHNAYAAAFEDPRFGPLKPEELEQLSIEVSVLSAPEPLNVRDDDDLHAQLEPAVHGLILNCLGRRATFLPQVWDSLPDPKRFVSELKRKAGLSPFTPASACAFARYTVSKHLEESA